MENRTEEPPCVTIVTAVRDCRKETVAYLAGLREHPPTVSFRVVLVDDGSEPETRDYLRSASASEGYLLERNEESRGFAFANNRGVAAGGESEWALFLNNDLLLTPDWFAPFAEVVAGKARLKALGCLGNVQLDPRTGRIDHAGVSFASGVPRHHLRGEREAPEAPYSEYLAVTGACLLMRRDLFLEVGGFDESYRTGFEDVDLCLRLRALGYRHYVANAARIFHKRGSSAQRNEHQESNVRTFYSRWGKLMTRFEEWDGVCLSASQGELTEEERKAWTRRRRELKSRGDGFLFHDLKVLLKMGAEYLGAGRLAHSLKLAELAVKSFPQEVEAWRSLAEASMGAKDYEQARTACERALVLAPGEPKLLNHLGEALRRAGKLKEASRVFKDACGRNSAYAKVRFNLGLCRLALKNARGAAEAFEKVVLFDPEHLKAWKLLAELRVQASEASGARAAWRRVLRLDPADAEAREQVAEGFLREGRRGEAFNLLLEGARLCEPSAKACARLGELAYGLGSFEQAAAWWRRSLEGEEWNAVAWNGLGNACVGAKDFVEAVRAYGRSLEIEPDAPAVLGNLANARAFLCDWSEREGELRRLRRYFNRNLFTPGAFEVLGLALNGEQAARAAEKVARRVREDLLAMRERLAFTFGRRRPGRRRIGFLSSDFRNHAVGHLFVGLLSRLNRERYETFIYSTGPDDSSEVREKLKAESEWFRDLSATGLAQSAETIWADDLDLLVDLGGRSLGANPELLALRPARRQAHYLGYAETLGSGLVDFYLADASTCPPSVRRHFAEEVVCMAGSFLPPGEGSAKPLSRRCPRAVAGLPEKGVVFCAFHAAYKIEPKIFDAWCRILKAVPDSVLWLKFKPAEDAMKKLRAEAVRRGIPSDRLVLAPDLPDRREHLYRLTAADLFLDAPAYNAHASAIDALRAGLPILTVSGDRFCSSVTTGLLDALGMKKFGVFKDSGAYVAAAIHLALSSGERRKLRRLLRERAPRVLCPNAHARRFENALGRILRKKEPQASSRVAFTKLIAPDFKASESAKGDDVSLSLLFVRQGHEGENWLADVLRAGRSAHEGETEVVVVAPSSTVPLKKPKSSGLLLRQVAAPASASPSVMLNLGMAECSGEVLCVLDDPVRPRGLNWARSSLHRLVEGGTGLLAAGSSSLPEAGCLVALRSTPGEEKDRVGIDAPCFFLRRSLLKEVGGLDARTFPDSSALLDFSLRCEQAGFPSALLSVPGFLPPVQSAEERLAVDGEASGRFEQRHGRVPVPLFPNASRPLDAPDYETANYQQWVSLVDTLSFPDLARFHDEADQLAHKPLISILLPVCDPPEKFLRKAIESVFAQAYSNWELCVADDASAKKFVRPLLRRYARKDPRVKVVFRKKNGHVSLASNSALKLAKGEYVTLLDHDDELRPHSLLEMVKAVNSRPEADLLYSDEDKVDEHGRRYDPLFKPDWNPDLFLGINYLCHLTVIRRSLVQEVGGFRKGFEGAQDWDLFLRLTERLAPESILHVPKVLYHWRAWSGSTALDLDVKRYGLRAAERALNEAIARRGLKAQALLPDPEIWRWRIRYRLPRKPPLVSILIPTRDRGDLLRSCIDSLRRTIKGAPCEILVLDNDTSELQALALLSKLRREPDIRVLRSKGEFNYSRINNHGARHAKGEVLLLLNNDVQAIRKGWFEEMLSHALRPEIGCVGPKLLYPDGAIQHAGVVLGPATCATHPFRGADGSSDGYMGALKLTRNYSALTAACLMVRKATYLDVGGLDEENFKVAFNDVDFCLRVREAGYRNLYTPHAVLHHAESASRGSDQTPERAARFQAEASGLMQRWLIPRLPDPCYNPNLTLRSEQYFFALPDAPQALAAKRLRRSGAVAFSVEAKKKKLSALRSLLAPAFATDWDRSHLCFDCLPPDASERHGVRETENISRHGYDKFALELLESLEPGEWALDCGAGCRPVYYEQVVNFDPVAYETTDVRGVGEELPFKDDSFAVVFSLAGLEHVRDPFRCAEEIARVLKPGGRLYCVVPFLQPYHGYPDHYYNMTASGLANLFQERLRIDRQEVIGSGLPIFSLTWMLRSWADGLPEQTRGEFVDKKVADLLGSPEDYLGCSFVTELPPEKNFEIGSTTALWAVKESSKTLSPKSTFSPGDHVVVGDVYRRHFQNLRHGRDKDEALKLLVGGDFDEVGQAEVKLLRYFGLNESDFLVDVGCGSGRLAIPLSLTHKGGYLGTDVVPEALEYARERVKRKDWRFEFVDALKIPLPEGSADMVCFFSVFTHLIHEQSFQYFEESFRVLKPGGKLVFSFLEFAVRSHWEHFESSALYYEQGGHLNVLMERNAIRAWAEMVGFECKAIVGKDGEGLVDFPELGTGFEQSLACLVKPVSAPPVLAG